MNAEQAGASHRTAFPSPVDLVDGAAALVSAALLVVAGLGVTGIGRVALALVFVTFVPGWAVLDVVPLANGAARAPVAVAISLSLCILVAVSAVWLHVWYPRALLDGAAGVCLAAALWHLAHPDVD